MNIFDFFTKFIMSFIFILKINSMNNVEISKLEIYSFRPGNDIVINDQSGNHDVQNIIGGNNSINDTENINDDNNNNDNNDITLDSSENKFTNPCSKYKLFYILGGVLLVGTGVGLYF